MCEKWVLGEKSGGEPLSLPGDKGYNKIEFSGAAKGAVCPGSCRERKLTGW
jgi:hypothetical protein